MNELHISGYVFKPEQKKTSNGKTLIKFALKYANGKDKEGKWKNAFLPVIIFSESLSLKDGEKVEVWGKIASDEWKDNNGENHKKTYAWADRIETMEQEQSNRQNWDNQSIGTEDSEIPF